MLRNTPLACLAAFAIACGGPQDTTTPPTTTGTGDTATGSTADTTTTTPTGPTGPTEAELEAARVQQAEEAFLQGADLVAAREVSDVDRIERLFTEAMEKNPEYTAEAWYNIGLARHAAGDVGGAIEAYRTATESDELFARGLANIGYIQMTDGDYAEAEATFNECIQRLETEPGCNINLAVLYEQGNASYEGDLIDAMIERYRFALGGDAHNGEAYANLSQIYYEQGQYELARMTCESGVLLGIEEGVLHNRLGLIALQLDEVITAYREFQRAVELDPDLVEAWTNIGAMALSFRDYEVALDAFERVLAEREGDLAVRLSYGAALRGVDRPEEAQAAYQEVLDRSPRHPGALFNMALLHQEAYQDYPTACGYYIEFLDTAPSGTDTYADAERRLANLHELVESLVFLQEATQEEADACLRR